jgi:hypothetical protein
LEAQVNQGAINLLQQTEAFKVQQESAELNHKEEVQKALKECTLLNQSLANQTLDHFKAISSVTNALEEAKGQIELLENDKAAQFNITQTLQQEHVELQRELNNYRIQKEELELSAMAQKGAFEKAINTVQAKLQATLLQLETSTQLCSNKDLLLYENTKALETLNKSLQEKCEENNKLKEYEDRIKIQLEELESQTRTIQSNYIQSLDNVANLERQNKEYMSELDIIKKELGMHQPKL